MLLETFRKEGQPLTAHLPPREKPWAEVKTTAGAMKLEAISISGA